MLGKFKGRRRKGRQRMRWLDGITNPMDMNLGKLWEMVRNRDPGVQQSMGSQRINAFKLWCWRRLLKVPWTARRSNQSILREIHLENLLERQMLKLKLQYFSHLM